MPRPIGAYARWRSANPACRSHRTPTVPCLPSPIPHPCWCCAWHAADKTKPISGHIYWVKEPEGSTNQGPEDVLTVNHSLRKEASLSAFLCEGIQCSVFAFIYLKTPKYNKHVAAARVDDGDNAAWTQTNASSGRGIALHADRFHRRDLQNRNPKEELECMGIKVTPMEQGESLQVIFR
jgi:hypothetical protein